MPFLLATVKDKIYAHNSAEATY